MNVIKHITSDLDSLKGRVVTGIPYGYASVYQSGIKIGYTIDEPSTTLDEGIITDLSGQKEFLVPIKYD